MNQHPAAPRQALLYIVHSGQLFGTERMALATLHALADRFDGHLLAPPGPIHAHARAQGVNTTVLNGRLGLPRAVASALRASRRAHAPTAVLSTGVSQALWVEALRRPTGWTGRHLHVVHGGTDERLSYGRKRLLNRFDVTQVAVSDFVAQRLKAHGVPADRIEVIPNFLAHDPGVRRALPHHGGVRRVVMLSRLDRIKRVGLLFDALERVPGLHGLHVDIYGSGEQAKALAERALAHPQVHLHGFQPQAVQALADADLLLHTCPEEPFGLVLLEAFSAGVPVLVPNAGGAADIVQADESGWHFTANDPVALGQQLLRLQQAPLDQLRRAIAGGHRLLAERYAPASRAQQYAALAAHTS